MTGFERMCFIWRGRKAVSFMCFALGSVSMGSGWQLPRVRQNFSPWAVQKGKLQDQSIVRIHSTAGWGTAVSAHVDSHSTKFLFETGAWRKPETPSRALVNLAEVGSNWEDLLWKLMHPIFHQFISSHVCMEHPAENHTCCPLAQRPIVCNDWSTAWPLPWVEEGMHLPAGVNDALIEPHLFAWQRHFYPHFTGGKLKHWVVEWVAWS